MALGRTMMSDAAVGKAQARAQALGIDLHQLRDSTRDCQPAQLSTKREQEERRRFLESLYDGSREGAELFERIIAGNELQQANFLPRGALAARAVLRVVIRGPGGTLIGYGTGFLIGEGVLITNNHVLQGPDVAAISEVEAYYEQGIDGTDLTVQRYALEPQRLWFTSTALDFSIVAVAPVDRTGKARLVEIGWLPLIGATGKALEGEWLTIVQHPEGKQKQLCVRENQLLKKDTDVLWYSTDTLGGSSGSPVFNNDWLVVALHHSGVPETKDGRWQTIDGRDFDPLRDGEDKVKWLANEGIRISRIIETLRADATMATHQLLQQVLGIGAGDVSVRLPIFFGKDATVLPRLLAAATEMTASGPQPAASVLPAPTTTSAGAITPPSASIRPSRETAMSQRLVTVTLAIDDSGRATIVGSGPREADLVGDLAEASKPKTKKQVIDAPVDEEKDWVKGFDPHFLDHADSVNLPELDQKRAALVAPLLRASAYGHQVPDEGTAAAGVLHYMGYSVVMNAERKLAFFSAANINGGVDFPNLSRPTDRWLFDDRISHDHQLGPTYYLRNAIDRGHLTRREDMEWGADPVEATRRANGTCTWTNCSPQQKFFNQDHNPNGPEHLWGGLEKYILEQTAEHYQFRVQAITGPIFDDENDPVYRKEKIPLDFWKVVVAIDADGDLFATGYVLSQKAVLDVTKLDEAAIVVPFGAFETYQRPLREIEEATGLRFTYGADRKPLSDKDPLAKELAKPAWKRRTRAASPATREAFGVDQVSAASAGPLSAFEDIILG